MGLPFPSAWKSMTFSILSWKARSLKTSMSNRRGDAVHLTTRAKLKGHFWKRNLTWSCLKTNTKAALKTKARIQTKQSSDSERSQKQNQKVILEDPDLTMTPVTQWHQAAVEDIEGLEQNPASGEWRLVRGRHFRRRSYDNPFWEPEHFDVFFQKSNEYRQLGLPL